jgi:hypothetical protein
MSLARTLIILPTVQLALLAIFVLYAVVAGTSSIQGPEVALAKLRGRRPRSVLLQGVLQPIVVLVLATPVAAFLAWLTVVLVRGHLLGRPVDVTFPTSAVEVAALAAAGGILATIVAARKIVVSPVAALLRRGGDSSGSSLGLALADAAAVTLALAGLVQLIAGGVLDSGHADPLSALAPTLIAVAAAVIVLRLLPYLGRAAVTSTRDSRRLAAFLAVRQIVRRPAGARVLLLVAVSIALATFAVTNWSVARSNREARALNQAGASTVLEVTPAAGIHDLRAAVDQADPSGQSMAAAVVRGPATSMLAVDTKRFADVAAWSSDYSPLSLHDTLAALTPTRPPAVSFTGDDLRFTVTMTRSPPRPVTLSVGVTGVDHFKHNYDVAVVHHGTGTYTQDVRPSCATTCRITSFALTPKQDLLADATHGSNVPRVVATVAAAAGHGPLWQPVTGFSEPRRWRDDGQAIANVRAGSGSLRLELEQSSPGGPWATILAEDVPAHLPAILASGTFGAYPGDSVHDVSVEGLDTGTQPIDGVAESVTLPELDRFGVMVDLGLAQQAMAAGPGFQTDYQIWLSPSAPKDLAARLARLGITVTKTIKSATYRAALDHTGPAFADGLFLVAAVAATLLAIGATVLGGVIAARRRAYELAALEAVGVAPRTLRRATAIEQGILLAAGLFVGLAAGIGGSMLALPTTPFFVDETIGPPTQHDLPIGLLAALVAGLAAVFLLTCFGVARLVLRQATAGRLREAQQ